MHTTIQTAVGGFVVNQFTEKTDTKPESNETRVFMDAASLLTFLETLYPITHTQEKVSPDSSVGAGSDTKLNASDTAAE